MASVTIVCEQAIFTSAKAPTGEGYRIVAASKGLRPEEKQKITRSSPSHESLCNPGDGEASPTGAAFYPLPGGRFCIASSRHAGAEHTGRGGQRVFTHNLVVSAQDFEAIGFNPFNLIRALPQAAIDVQTLPSNGTLPSLELYVDAASTTRISADCAKLLPHAVRHSAVLLLMEGKPTVVDLPSNWLSWAEALLLSIPAPQRSRISFAAGLRFLAGRGHAFYFLRDEKNAVQGRVAAQGISFVGPRSTPSPIKSHWLTFVDRHWDAGDLSGLARRTSRKFEDCSHQARERVGETFNAIDTLSQTDSSVVLDFVFRSFNASQSGVEADIRREYREAAQRQLLSRYAGAGFLQMKPIWFRLVEFWRNGGEAAVFAQPLINLSLGAALRGDPLAAAELALAVTQVPQGTDRDAHESMIKQVVGRLVTLDCNSTSEDAEKLAKIVTRLRAVRPSCPLVAKLSERTAPSHAAP